MHVLRDAPIRSKIIFITLLTSGVALLLTCLAFVTYEMVVFKTDMVDELSITAAMIADNSSAALTFNDPVSAAQTLKSLRAHSHIVEAAIYDAHGKVFAEYDREPPLAFRLPAIEADGQRFDGGGLKLFRAINLPLRHEFDEQALDARRQGVRCADHVKCQPFLMANARI